MTIEFSDVELKLLAKVTRHAPIGRADLLKGKSPPVYGKWKKAIKRLVNDKYLQTDRLINHKTDSMGRQISVIKTFITLTDTGRDAIGKHRLIDESNK